MTRCGPVYRSEAARAFDPGLVGILNNALFSVAILNDEKQMLIPQVLKIHKELNGSGG